MSELYYIVSGLLGLVILIGGAEKVVDHSVGLMKQKGLSGGLVGLTLISVGTSFPEILTHVLASVGVVTGQRRLEVASGTVLGMNVGSDIEQQNLLLGVVGLISVLHVTKTFLKRDFTALIAAATLLWLLSLGGTLSRADGVILILFYAGYLALLYRQRHEDADLSDVKEKDPDLRPRPTWVRLCWITGGLLVVVAAGEILLRAVEHAVSRFGISESLIGVTLIGISTSLPEFVTAVSSMRKNEMGLSMGTLVGSNVTNPTLGVGLGAVISTYAVPTAVLWYDMPVKIGTAILILGGLMVSRKLTRWQAIAMISVYFIYLGGRGWMFRGADVYGP